MIRQVIRSCNQKRRNYLGLRLNKFDYSKRWFSINPFGLRILPLQKLEPMMNKYLDSISPLCSPKDYHYHEMLAMDFIHSKLGNYLHNQVEQMYKASNEGDEIGSWVENLWSDMYLKQRWALPLSSNVGMILDNDKINGLNENQVNNASIMIHFMLQWMMLVSNTNYLEETKQNECIARYLLQFGIARIPHETSDQILKVNNSKHIVILYQNSFYKVNVVSNDNEIISIEQLKQVIENIKNTNNINNDTFIGFGTCQDRDSWAITKNRISEVSLNNQQVLEDIDTSLFIICLDNNTSDDEFHDIMHGDACENRWFDKNQLVINENGLVGFNFESSQSDHMIWTNMIDDIVNLINTNSEFPTLSDNEFKLGELLNLDFTDVLRSDLMVAKDVGENLTKEILITENSFDISILNEMNKDIQNVFQHILQLNYYKVHYKIGSLGISCPMNHFLHGRFDYIRALTDKSKEFVLLSDDELDFNSLELSMQEYLDNKKEVQNGFGVDCHLYGLEMINRSQNLVNQNVPIHQLFESELYQHSKLFTMCLNTINSSNIKNLIYPPIAFDSYQITCNIVNDKLNTTITTLEESTHSDNLEFNEQLEDTFEDILNYYEES